MKVIMATLLISCCIGCTGCTGMELGGKLWVTRVDEKQESQRTYNVPLKCYLWATCAKPGTVDVEDLK